MSMGHYLTRCRVGAAFGPLRDPDSNVGAIAFGVGYQSTKNLYRALHELTGMTPSQVRHLTNEEAERVLQSQLRLPPPHVRTTGMKSSALSPLTDERPCRRSDGQVPPLLSSSVSETQGV